MEEGGQRALAHCDTVRSTATTVNRRRPAPPLFLLVSVPVVPHVFLAELGLTPHPPLPSLGLILVIPPLPLLQPCRPSATSWTRTAGERGRSHKRARVIRPLLPTSEAAMQRADTVRLLTRRLHVRALRFAVRAATLVRAPRVSALAPPSTPVV